MITTRPNLDILLDTALKTGGESPEFDFKEILDPSLLPHKVKLVKLITAFANTDRGGYLIIGVSDSLEITGLDPRIAAKYDQTDIQKWLRKFVAPIPRFLARHHQRDDKLLVIIEVYPFLEVPHVIISGTSAAGPRLEQGVIYTRTAGAECAPITSETEMRRLCDAITKRHANRFLELVQRGLLSLPGGKIARPATSSLADIRQRADHYQDVSSSPYIEVFFEPLEKKQLRLSDMKKAIPKACVAAAGYSFPVTFYQDRQVYRLENFGWLGLETSQAGKLPAGFVWLFDRNGTFLYRDPLWEDEKNSAIQGGVGLYHIIGLLVLLVRFLHRLILTLGTIRDSSFRIGVRLEGVRGRYLDIETRQKRHRRSNIEENTVEAGLEIAADYLLQSRMEIVVTLVEEICWQFRLTTLAREQLLNMVLSAPKHLGEVYQFPDHEVL